MNKNYIHLLNMYEQQWSYLRGLAGQQVRVLVSVGYKLELRVPAHIIFLV